MAGAGQVAGGEEADTAEAGEELPGGDGSMDEPSELRLTKSVVPGSGGQGSRLEASTLRLARLKNAASRVGSLLFRMASIEKTANRPTSCSRVVHSSGKNARSYMDLLSNAYVASRRAGDVGNHYGRVCRIDSLDNGFVLNVIIRKGHDLTGANL